MSSTSTSDEECENDYKNPELIVNDENDKLEASLKSFELEDRSNDTLLSATEEGNKVRKKSSTSTINNSKEEFSNWRSTVHPRLTETKQSASVSQVCDWRNPDFKYERCKQINKASASSSRSRYFDDSNRDQPNASYGKYRVRQNRGYSFENEAAHSHTSEKYRDNSKKGNWIIPCAPDIILDNEMTEVEHVRKCLKELHEQNGHLFAAHRPSEYVTPRGDTRFNCFTSNYEDKDHVAKVADMLLKAIGEYPYCIYYYYKNKPLYMRTCEGELYECIDGSWKITDS